MRAFETRLIPVLTVLFVCAVVRAAPSEAPVAGVTLSQKPSSVVLDNGIVKVEISRTSGNVLAVTYKNQSLLIEPAYLDWVAARNNHLNHCTFTVRTDPSKNAGEMAEVVLSQKYAPTDGTALDVELHHVLRRGDSGFYSYVVFSHPSSYPAADMAQSRMVFRPAANLFNFINIDDDRRREMPAPGTPNKPMGPKESMLITEGPFKGYMADKYHMFADAGDYLVHGWTGTQSHLGCFIVDGSTEDQNGGPTKQHNTAHFPNVLLKILTCGHYGAAGVSIPANTQWQKMYGPWMFYVNSADSNDALWADAKQKASLARASWPYSWVNDPAYLPEAQRGAVAGRLQISDPQDPSVSPKGAWIGLAAPEPDWQQQSLNYQFWTRAEADGKFQIPHVRPGNYTLYAFVDGVMGEFRRDGVTVSAGQTLDLSDIKWVPERFGRQLWQIGTPDRTAKEFRHGDDYREWGLWQKYPQEFPNDVNFIIGQSKERTDWNYAQVTEQKNGEWVGTTWTVQFDVNDPIKPGQADLRLAFAAANNANLLVSINGNAIGAAITDLGSDNAVARAGIHGQYHLRDLKFATSLLKPGRNVLTLSQRSGKSFQKNVMYDCLRLEVPF